MITNGGYIHHYVEKLDQQVHSGMWAALHSDKDGTIDRILKAVLGIPTTARRRRRLVLCGHSLGGGYALLTALELLGTTAASPELEFCMHPVVVTFGAPMVLFSKIDSPLWRSLATRATLLVNAWDFVPRLPSCETWIFKVLPQVTVCGIALNLGFKAGLGGSNAVESTKVLMNYEPCGTLAIVDANKPGEVSCLPPHSPTLQRAFLDKLPGVSGFFVVRDHETSGYLKALTPPKSKTSEEVIAEKQITVMGGAAITAGTLGAFALGPVTAVIAAGAVTCVAAGDRGKAGDMARAIGSMAVGAAQAAASGASATAQTIAPKTTSTVRSTMARNGGIASVGGAALAAGTLGLFVGPVTAVMAAGAATCAAAGGRGTAGDMARAVGSSATSTGSYATSVVRRSFFGSK
jgi:hypothetical protein